MNSNIDKEDFINEQMQVHHCTLEEAIQLYDLQELYGPFDTFEEMWNSIFSDEDDA